MAEQRPFADVGLATNPEPAAGRAFCYWTLLVRWARGYCSNAGKSLGYTIQRDGKTCQAVFRRNYPNRFFA